MWLYTKGIQLEKDNESVVHGKLVHEYSYLNKKDKELLIDNLLMIDIIDKKYVHEVKLSSNAGIIFL